MIAGGEGAASFCGSSGWAGAKSKREEGGVLNFWPSLLQALGQTLRAAPSRQGLELGIGEVVQATLLEILDDRTAVFQIKGQTVQAQLETQLPKGVTVPLIVMGATENGMLELKVSPFAHNRLADKPDAVLPQLEGLDKATAQSVGKLVQNLGIKDSPLVRQIVGRLLAAEISVTPSLVNTIEALLTEDAPRESLQTGKPPGNPEPASAAPVQKTEAGAGNSRTAASLETIVHMIRRNIPLTSAAFQAMKTLWQGAPLSEILLRISNADSHANDARSDAVRTGAGQAASALRSMPAEPAPGAQKGVAETPFSQSNRDSSMFTVARTGSQAAEIGNPAAENQPDRTVGAPANFSVRDLLLRLERLENLPASQRGPEIQAIVSRLGLAHEQRMTFLKNPQATVPQATAATETLKSWLLANLQAGAGPADPAIQQAAHHVTGQQLMYSAKNEPGAFLYQFMALPLLVGNETADAKIHLLTRKKRGKRLDPYNCFLYFQLQFPTLGELGLHVQIVERMVSLRLVLQDAERLVLDKEDISRLREGLMQAGYSLGTVRKETGTTDPVSPFLQLPVLVTGGALDLRI